MNDRPAAPDVSVFLPSLEGGGAERVMLDLIGDFAGRGLRIDLILAQARGAYLAEVPTAVSLIDLDRARVSSAFLPLLRHLRRTRPKALFSTLEHANVVALMAARWVPGLRVVVREANTLSHDLATEDARSRLLLGLMRFSYRRADAVIAVSEGVADGLRSGLGVPDERLRVIANPVITPRLLDGGRAPVEHRFFDRRDVPVVVAVGRLTPQKGFDVLLRAFARLRRRRPCRLLILGEGESRGALEALAHALAIQEDLDMPGFVANPFPMMAAADLFVLSSAWEGLPNVLIQALALGTRAVSTDCPSGPREILDQGALGALVPVGDDEAMAQAMEAALDKAPFSPPATWFERYALASVAGRYLRVLDGQG